MASEEGGIMSEDNKTITCPKCGHDANIDHNMVIEDVDYHITIYKNYLVYKCSNCRTLIYRNEKEVL